MRLRSLLLAGALASGPAGAEITLAPVWGDHMVIQRDRPVVVEGSAAPGAQVAAALGAAHALATAGADGRFILRFPARPASLEPVTLHVTAGAEVATVSDIVTGDVWLCSGQSNMAMTVSAALNGFNTIQASADPYLRLLTVPQATSPRPESTFAAPVAWQSAAPETTGDFSAACYHMLKSLRDARDVPQGAIHASWGGSQIRPWLSPEAGAALYGREQMALLDLHARDPLAAVAAFAPAWEAWWRQRTGMEPWSDPDALAWQPVPAISPWPGWQHTPLAQKPTGNVLLRQTMSLTAEQAGSGGTLHLGIIDDLDATFVNGRMVGITHGWATERAYHIPAEYLREGTNEILLVASNSWGSGGFASGAERLFFVPGEGPPIALGEGWRFSIAGHDDMPPRAPWDANAGIGVMHNRMIAPIGRFALAGAAWYQGESDVGIPGYRDRLRELFAGWRRQFGADMRMLVVQLANYGPVASTPVASGWAELRQEQLAAVTADANAALVTAIDIGERTDIHPANKIVLGQRLALAAQGIALPMPAKAVRQGNLIRVSFTGVEAGLAAWSGPVAIAFELCAETQDSCRFAMARVKGDSAYLADDGRPATRVRHAWADSPVVNAHDGRTLPLPGFEIAIGD